MHTMAKRLFSGLASLVLCLMAAMPVLAVSQGAAWTTVRGQQVLVYLQGTSPDADFTCQIGSTLAVPTQVQQIQELETPVHTVILVDNSVSIPSSQRPLVQEILEAAAGNHLQGEQFSVATISETVTWLCEAQTDYLQVKTVLDSIVYNDQQTRLTDCLYEAITYLQQQCPGQFCRILLVADGVDDQQVGYTRQELDALIQQAGYPIYTIGCTNTGVDGNQELQQLFALARLTSGQAFYLAENQDVHAIAAGIAAWNSGVQLVFDLPADLCDGSTRQMQVVSGDITYTFPVEMPFGIAAAPTAVPAMRTTPAPATVQPQLPLQPAQTAFSLPLWAVFVMIGGVAAVAVIVAVVLVAGRRDRAAMQQRYSGGGSASTAETPTELLGEQGQGGPPTDTPWNNGCGATLRLCITDVNNPVHTFQTHLQEGAPLVLGRDPARCQILIDHEPSLSRTQCEISLRDGEVWLHNLSQANITQVNGQRIEGDCCLQSGSTLKMGRLLMKVEYRP